MITVYIKKFCPYCVRLLALLETADIPYRIVDIIEESKQGEMMGLSGERGVPQVHIGNIIMPDYDTEETLVSDIQWLLKNSESPTEDIQRNTTSKIIPIPC